MAISGCESDSARSMGYCHLHALGLGCLSIPDVLRTSCAQSVSLFCFLITVFKLAVVDDTFYPDTPWTSYLQIPKCCSITCPRPLCVFLPDSKSACERLGRCLIPISTGVYRKDALIFRPDTISSRH